jgi:hypothetical protein
MAEPEPQAGAAARTSRPSCVIFSAHPWADTPFGLHHIARAMARHSWNVLFVETPYTPLHALAGRRRGRARSPAPRPTEHPDLKVYSPFLLLPMSARGFEGSLVPIEYCTRFTSPNVVEALRHSAFANPDLLLLGSPLGLSLSDALRPKLTAYRMADDLSLLPRIGSALVAAERRAVATADAVIATTARLADKAKGLGAARIIEAANGVDTAHFSRPRPEPVTTYSLRDEELPRVGGLLDRYLETDDTEETPAVDRT